MALNKNTLADRSFDIRELIKLVWKRKWLVIIPAFLSTCAAIGATYLLTPIYDSSTIIQVDAEIRLIGELQRLVGPSTNWERQSSQARRDRLNSIFNEITSTQYTALLNDRLQLGSQPGVQEEARQYVLKQPNMSFETAVLNVLQLELKNNIGVSWAAGDQIELTVQSADPVQAKDIADHVAQIFIEERLKQELSQIRSSQDFSDIQLERYEKLLEDKISQRTILEQQLIGIQLDESIISESNRTEISDEISRTQEEINDLRNQERSLLTELETLTGLPRSQITLEQSDVIEREEEKLKNQLRSTGDMMIKYAWSHPQVLNFKLRLNNIIGTIERENGRLVGEQFSSQDETTRFKLQQLFDIRTNLTYLYTKKPYLESAMDELRTKTNLIPEYRARLDEIAQEIEATTDLRDRFKRQQESSAISQALAQDMSSSKYRVVEPAKLSLGPISPNRKKLTIMGFLLGVLLGAAAILLAELFDSSFKKVEEVEQYLNLPVLGIVSKIETIKKL